MVEYAVRRTTARGRAGTLRKWGSVEVNHATPCFLVYTRAGHIPHLTWEVASTQLSLSQQPPIYQLTLPSLIEMQPQLEACGGGVHRFCGLPAGAPTHLAIEDPLQERKSGYNDSVSVAIWNHTGKRSLTPSLLAKAASACGSSSVDALLDYDTPEGTTSLKRRHKAVERTAGWHAQMEALLAPSIGLVSAVGGGDSGQHRRKLAEFHASAPTVSIDVRGFDDSEKWRDLLHESVKPLSPASLRLAHGAFSPSEVVSLVAGGVDVVDSSWTVMMAEKGCGFRIPDAFPSTTSDVEVVDYNDQGGKATFTPPFADCSCYTCSNYTTAYLCHLHNTKELLAPILLVIHNLSQWDKMFIQIRRQIDGGEEVQEEAPVEGGDN